MDMVGSGRGWGLQWPEYWASAILLEHRQFESWEQLCSFISSLSEVCTQWWSCSVVGHISRYTFLLYVSPAGLCNLGLSGALLTELENNYFIPVPNTTLCNRGIFSFCSPSGTLRPGYLTPCSLSLFFHSTFQAQGKCSCLPEKEGKLEVWGHLMLIFPRLSHGAHRVSGASSRAPITLWTPNQSPLGCIVPCPPSP